MTTQTEKILQGCRKYTTIKGKGAMNCGMMSSLNGLWLCPTCKAQAQTLLEAKKEEVEFLENSETTKEFSYCEDIKERISSLKSDINKLEGIK